MKLWLDISTYNSFWRGYHSINLEELSPSTTQLLLNNVASILKSIELGPENFDFKTIFKNSKGNYTAPLDSFVVFKLSIDRVLPEYTVIVAVDEEAIELSDLAFLSQNIYEFPKL